MRARFARVLPPTVALAIGVGRTAAHVEYVAGDEHPHHDPVGFTLSVLGDPVNLALLAVGAVCAGVLVVGYLAVGRRTRDVQVLRETLTGYGDLVPWMLRLSLGLPLVGAGFAGYLFSPAVEIPARMFQVAVGFLLLFGLATRIVATIGLGVYLVALVSTPALLLAGEYVGGLLALVLLGSGRPSADELLQRVAEAEGSLYGRLDPVHELAGRFQRHVDPFSGFAPTVVRVGLGATFVYLGLVEKLMAPGRAVAVVARYDLTALVPVDPGLWVVGVALVEIGLGLALVVGLFTRGAAAAAFLVLTATLFGFPDDPVLAHVSLFGLASVVFTTGSGPLAVDRVLGRVGAPEDGTDGRPRG